MVSIIARCPRAAIAGRSGWPAACLLALGWCAASLAADEPSPAIDAGTIRGKVMCGYQGWFRCPGDGSNQGWIHWSRDSRRIAASTLTFEMWPDMGECAADECFAASGFTYPDGSPAALFSSANSKTVLRHFQWMRDYGIDGGVAAAFRRRLTRRAFPGSLSLAAAYGRPRGRRRRRDEACLGAVVRCVRHAGGATFFSAERRLEENGRRKDRPASALPAHRRAAGRSGLGFLSRQSRHRDDSRAGRQADRFLSCPRTVSGLPGGRWRLGLAQQSGPAVASMLPPVRRLRALECRQLFDRCRGGQTRHDELLGRRPARVSAQRNVLDPVGLPGLQLG